VLITAKEALNHVLFCMLIILGSNITLTKLLSTNDLVPKRSIWIFVFCFLGGLICLHGAAGLAVLWAV